MLSRAKRLTAERDFKRVYQKGSFFGGAGFGINFIPNKMSVTRIGIVVSKKVAAKATARNKIKRKYREASRQLYGLLPAGYDVIVTIKKADGEYPQIQAALKKTFLEVKK